MRNYLSTLLEYSITHYWLDKEEADAIFDKRYITDKASKSIAKVFAVN